MAVEFISIVLSMASDIADEPGDFGIRIRDDALHVPYILSRFLDASGIEDAEGLLCHVDMDPVAYAEALAWDVSEVQKAVATLRGQLREAFPDREWMPVGDTVAERSLNARPSSNPPAA